MKITVSYEKDNDRFVDMVYCVDLIVHKFHNLCHCNTLFYLISLFYYHSVIQLFSLLFSDYYYSIIQLLLFSIFNFLLIFFFIIMFNVQCYYYYYYSICFDLLD